MSEISSFSAAISTLGFPVVVAAALLWFLGSKLWPYLAEQQRQHQAHREGIQKELMKLNQSIQSLAALIESNQSSKNPYTAPPAAAAQKRNDK